MTIQLFYNALVANILIEYKIPLNQLNLLSITTDFNHSSGSRSFTVTFELPDGSVNSKRIDELDFT